MTTSPTVETRDHPEGEAGVRYSLDQVASFATEAQSAFRLPKIRAYTIETLERYRRAKLGDVDTDEGRARACLWSCQEKIWVPDPVATEFMQGAHLMVCAPGEYCFHGGDCDDLTILLCAMYLSIGLYACIVGHGYGQDGTIQHVLGAVWVNRRWYHTDPSKPRGRPHFTFGNCAPFTRERVLALPNKKVICDARSCFQPGTLDPNTIGVMDKGVFVGVNGAPALSRIQWIAPAVAKPSTRIEWLKRPPSTLGELAQTAHETALLTAEDQRLQKQDEGLERRLSTTEKIAIAGVLVSALGVLGNLWLLSHSVGPNANPLDPNPMPKTFGKRVRKEIATEQRGQARQRVRALRGEVKRAREDRHLALRDLSQACHGRIDRIRDEARAAREAAKRAREEVTTECRTERAEIRERGREEIESAVQALLSEREYQKAIHPTKAIVSTTRRTRGEALQESDDEVRRNISAHLIPIFNRVRRSIKASPGRSRTEAFEEWVEAHPDEVLATEAESAERDADQMFHEYMDQLAQGRG